MHFAAILYHAERQKASRPHGPLAFQVLFHGQRELLAAVSCCDNHAHRAGGGSGAQHGLQSAVVGAVALSGVGLRVEWFSITQRGQLCRAGHGHRDRAVLPCLLGSFATLPLAYYGVLFIMNICTYNEMMGLCALAFSRLEPKAAEFEAQKKLAEAEKAPAAE